MKLYGIEQEVPLLKDGDKFVDFTNTSFEEIQAVIDKLPIFEGDYPKLRIGDLGIKKKRWYIEGYERFKEDGTYLRTIPKGLEIRTVPQETIEETLAELAQDYDILRSALSSSSFQSTWISHHPFLSKFTIDPDLNKAEIKKRSESPELLTADISQITFGPDFNFSYSEMSDSKLIDVAKKLTYYSPGIIPFSFSSPFFEGKKWTGNSVRTFKRTGKRPAVLVFINDKKNLINSNPSLTQVSRIPFEKGRIEFKSFDLCNDIKLIASLFALVEGIILDETLSGRAITPDAQIHKRAAQYGFSDHLVSSIAKEALIASEKSLGGRKKEIEPLWDLLSSPHKAPIWSMIHEYENTGSIIETLKSYENLNI